MDYIPDNPCLECIHYDARSKTLDISICGDYDNIIYCPSIIRYRGEIDGQKDLISFMLLESHRLNMYANIPWLESMLDKLNKIEGGIR